MDFKGKLWYRPKNIDQGWLCGRTDQSLINASELPSVGEKKTLDLWKEKAFFSE